MARPVKELNEDQIYELASMHCTMKEIASVMDCSVDTLERRFADLIDKGKDQGRTNLRRAQITCALKGNATMLIWLGKQMLGQKESFSDIVAPETLKSFDFMMNQLEIMQRNRHNPSQEIKEEGIHD